MNAMLLAAGEGTRLPQARFFGSKVLVPVQGKTILEWNLLFLKRAKIREVVINLCAGKEKILAFLKRKRLKGLRVALSFEDTPMGTAGGVKKARALLGFKDFLVLYGDNLCDFNIAKLWRAHCKNRALATLGVFNPQTTAHSGLLAGWVNVNGQGSVESFVEKRNNTKVPEGGFIHAGVAILSPEIFDEIQAGSCSDFAKDVYPALLRKRKKIFAVEGASFVLASDTPDALRKTRRLFKKHRKYRRALWT